jgi:hypothetical protein
MAPDRSDILGKGRSAMKLNSWMLGVAMSLLACASVNAQPGGGRGGFGGGFGGQQSLISLANNEAVQKELTVDEQGKAAIKEINDEYRAELQKSMGEGGGFGNFREMSEEERQKAMEKMTASRKAVNDKFLPDLKEALTSAQYKRLQEISWQAARSQVYSDPEFAKALGLKKEQQDKLAAITKEYGEKQRALFTGGGEGGRPDFQAMRTKTEELNKERDEKLNEVLTKDQQAKAKSLKGKEFDVAQLQPRGFGGPGGPGGAGGRPGGTRGQGAPGGRPSGGDSARPKRPE